MSWLDVIRVRQQNLNQHGMATEMIQQKGMTFHHDFGYSFISPFLFPPKKRGEKKKMNSKNHDKKSFLSARFKCLFILRSIKGCTKKIWTLLNRVYKFNLYITFISLKLTKLFLKISLKNCFLCTLRLIFDIIYH